MTPKLFYKIARNTEKSNKKLTKLASILLVMFLMLSIVNAMFFDVLIAITLTPLGILFFIFGLRILQTWFKDEIDKTSKDFGGFWQNKNLVGKIYLWYSSFFMSLWFVGVTLVSCFSVIHTVLFICSRSLL